MPFLEQPVGSLENIKYIRLRDGAGGFLELPELTTSERNDLDAANGMFIFNTTTNQVECYTNGGWSGWTGGINWRSSWATATSYSGNEAVENDGTAYICTTAHTSGASTEPGVGASWTSYWDVMAEKGDAGAAGQLVGSGAWATATSYTADVDVVENDGSGYVCKTTHTSGDHDDEPGVGAVWTDYWELLVSKGDTGATGPAGAAGADGLPGGDSFEFAFDTTTAKADPASTPCKRPITAVPLRVARVTEVNLFSMRRSS